MKTLEELQADLDAAQAALDTYVEPKDDIGRYLVGHIDDLDIANRVLAVFKKAGIDMVQDTYSSLDDAQLHGALLQCGFWDRASGAGLFFANLSCGPTYTSTSVGFRCVARPATAMEIISAETFLRRFENEDT